MVTPDVRAALQALLGGYRRTCGKHMQWWDERPNVRANGRP